MGNPDYFNWNAGHTDPLLWAQVAETRAKSRELNGAYAELTQAYDQLNALNQAHTELLDLNHRQAAYINRLESELNNANYHVHKLRNLVAEYRNYFRTKGGTQAKLEDGSVVSHEPAANENLDLKHYLITAYKVIPNLCPSAVVTFTKYILANNLLDYNYLQKNYDQITELALIFREHLTSTQFNQPFDHIRFLKLIENQFSRADIQALFPDLSLSKFKAISPVLNFLIGKFPFSEVQLRTQVLERMSCIPLSEVVA